MLYSVSWSNVCTKPFPEINFFTKQSRLLRRSLNRARLTLIFRENVNSPLETAEEESLLLGFTSNQNKKKFAARWNQLCLLPKFFSLNETEAAFTFLASTRRDRADCEICHGGTKALVIS